VMPLLVHVPHAVPRSDDAGREPALLSVGRIAPNKCLEDVIRVHHAVRRELAAAQLWIVGDGNRLRTYGDSLQRLVAHLGEETHVQRLGAVSRAELDVRYRRAGLYVSMSEHEGFGGPLLEAMLAGLPVLAYDAGAVAETLGDAGVLLPRKDPVVAAEIALQVLRDGALQERLGERGRRRAAELVGARVVDTLLEALRGCGMLDAVAVA
jgi:L-malate glycosyltransferase